MVKINNLRIGQHVLVGSNYKSFSVPKHFAIVTHICDEFILCVSDPEHGYPDAYKESEIEGIKIDVPMLEKFDFYRSRLKSSRWFYNTPKVRITYDFKDGSLTAHHKQLIQRTGVKYLHEFESALSDVDLNLNIFD